MKCVNVVVAQPKDTDNTTSTTFIDSIQIFHG